MDNFQEYPFVLSAMFSMILEWVLVFVIANFIAKAKIKKQKRKEHYQNSSVNSTYNIPSQTESRPQTPDSYNKLSQDEKAIALLNDDHFMLNVGFKIYLCNTYNGLFFEESEAVFYFQAKAYANEHGLELLSKVRISDIIYIPNADRNSGKYYSNNEVLERSIRCKHFDFVFCRRYLGQKSNGVNITPFLIVEIDGVSHQNRERIIRDEMVDMLISRANQHGNTIKIIHIHRRTLDGMNTQWQTIRYKSGGLQENTGDWLSINELLDRYTKP